MALLPIRTFGDPILRRPAVAVQPSEIGPDLRKLADDMLETMYDAPGVGLAGPQVGIEKRIFVYDVGSGPGVLINPEIVHSEGTWSYNEGCLSVPGMWFEIERPAFVVARGLDLDGKEITVEGDELMGRMLLHETDHLEGKLLIDRLERDKRKAALAEIRRRFV
jgi:peptide deformylase